MQVSGAHGGSGGREDMAAYVSGPELAILDEQSPGVSDRPVFSFMCRGNSRQEVGSVVLADEVLILELGAIDGFPTSALRTMFSGQPGSPAEKAGSPTCHDSISATPQMPCKTDLDVTC